MPSRIASVSGSEIRIVVPKPFAERMSMVPPIAVMLRLTTSMPTPRPETSVTVSAVEKPGAKISCQTSASGMLSDTGRPFCCRLGQDALAIQAAAVVGHLDHDVAALVGRGQEQAARFGFAGGDAGGRHLDAVVDRVAHQVGQRIDDAFDQALVQFRRGAVGDEVDLLAQLAARSRTMRGKRENTKSIGIMRIDITASCRSRVLRVSWTPTPAGAGAPSGPGRRCAARSWPG
jgi:hypothetical protein